jgi:hypothetical protein
MIAPSAIASSSKKASVNTLLSKRAARPGLVNIFTTGEGTAGLERYL